MYMYTASSNARYANPPKKATAHQELQDISTAYAPTRSYARRETSPTTQLKPPSGNSNIFDRKHPSPSMQNTT